ncbi:MAG TPA: microcin C ABC transporter permease YejB [Azospirillaceae bacterium]|nr:microcin C ABC transporter permease YejB [Azospirillaceae bacterium]
MLAYAVRRLLLLVPTLLLILAVNFLLVQLAPGGPIERLAAELEGEAVEATARIGGGGGGTAAAEPGAYRGARGLDPEIIRELEREFGFDRPWPERFARMVAGYLAFDLGRSFFRDRPVTELVLQKLPVSVTLGLWSTLLVYAVSVPLGMAKAVRDGSAFDAWTSGLVVVGYAVPGFMVAVLLVVLFAGGSYLSWFPLRGLTSEGWEEMSLPGRVLDYLWHAALPVLSLVLGGFAGLTMLTKNSFLEELRKPYVTTARAKGLAPRRVLYGHVFRNAMLVVLASFPQALVGVLFTGALMVEVIFSLDGIGLLGFEAVVNRDYPVIFGTLYLLSLLGLLMNLAGDLVAAWSDPRIDFGARA